ncbi:Pkinase-domain-containing protein [Venturia nashicola]|uniref:non-specific serine/threonine protein kinase n=1 Tax=Venturia nashicola TaxID=86259 RepID=A0A4Z1PKM9_9PEZI|nr:Pkinase-domain-containing protein [Venturia nashicola]
MSSGSTVAPISTSTNRQYQNSTHNPQLYYSNSSSLPAPSRKPLRSSNGASPQTPTSHHSPAEPSTSTLTTPRAVPLPSSENNSPAIPMNAPAAPSSHPPAGPVPPPRTSSHHHNQTGTSTPPTQTRNQPGSSRESAVYMKEAEAYQRAAAANAAQGRRRAEESASRKETGSSGRSKPSPGHSRSQSAVGQPPMGTDLPREDSTIINRLVIDDPADDLEREKARIAESRPLPISDDMSSSKTGQSTLVGSDAMQDGPGHSAPRTRQEKSERRVKETRFGEYILGQTLGEGEFGKVKMGWKRDGGVQVAIKLIRRETLGSNPSRLPKIYREIQILRGLQHPNIVRLHEMVETERHIGIILEYASGGELFDYILQHRFLKDNAARRLFAQLVSGVGYLHKKGIVHRDLKLENLLLDRNRNIIITDFGFANTFNSNDELGEETEYNLGNREYVKKMGLDTVRDDGHRRGDLMQTSCGSPCYAAPELVVSDSLYTGRKVDVWSCGVILYAMLAGYLPFDDDPANPEGDNINLLYKYIVSTPLTFPEYVTPHARDLLKRILVPDPRKRADLFEVARHSWLSEYAHVVGFITSSTTTTNDIANTTVSAEDAYEPPHLARSASVREPTKAHAPAPSVIGGLVQKQGQVDQPDKQKSRRDDKRRTVQVEYVAPQSSTQRGDAAATAQAKTRARSESQGPVEVSAADGVYQNATRASQRASSSAAPNTNTISPPIRPGRDQQRATSESVAQALVTGQARPNTGGSMSANSKVPGSRGNSYGQPAIGVAREQAQGRFSQPRGKQYTTMPNDANSYAQPPSNRNSTYLETPAQNDRSSFYSKGHKRSSTVGDFSEKLFGKRASFFGMKTNSYQSKTEKPEKSSRSKPPVSMTKPIPNDAQEPRRSTDSRRPSFSFSRNNSTSQPPDNTRASRRFSFIPASLAESFRGNRYSQQAPPSSSGSTRQGRTRSGSRTKMAFGRGESPSPSQSTLASTIPALGDNQYERPRESSSQMRQTSAQAAPHNRYQNQSYPQQEAYDESNQSLPYETPREHPDEYYGESTTSVQPDSYPQYPTGFNEYDQAESYSQQRKDKSVLQKPHRNFPGGYENEGNGSGGRAKRVMDFFRMRSGKSRS